MDTHAYPGDELELEILDFEDAYFTLRPVGDHVAVVIALEVWGCSVCQRVQIARLHFDRVDPTHWRFMSATVVPLSGAVLDEANFVSRRLEERAPGPMDDVERVRAIARQFGITS